MARVADKLENDRAVRNAAREAFDTRLAQVKLDLKARSLGGRVVDKVSKEANEALEEAVEIADQNRGVVAGTIAALALWFLRNPILAWTTGRQESDANQEEEADRE